MSKEAKLKFKAGSFDIIEHGDHVLCSVSGKKILLSWLDNKFLTLNCICQCMK